MATATKHTYIEAVGRRKTARARVRITEGKQHAIEVNGKPFSEYFTLKDEQMTVESAFVEASLPKKFTVTARVTGGGIKAQSEALRHGISRALVAYDLTLRVPLKQKGFLKRDPRVKERRKFGLKKARRAPQWSKR
ncbi:MAG TPA: 30S ribosomal protein S9 [Candidatus Paceibacterota bacterium]|jgi:small subunit ribosomal protein S9